MIFSTAAKYMVMFTSIILNIDLDIKYVVTSSVPCDGCSLKKIGRELCEKTAKVWCCVCVLSSFGVIAS